MPEPGAVLSPAFVAATPVRCTVRGELRDVAAGEAFDAAEIAPEDLERLLAVGALVAQR